MAGSLRVCMTTGRPQYVRIKNYCCMLLCGAVYSSFNLQASRRDSVIFTLGLFGFHQLEYHTKDDLACQGTQVPHYLHFSAIPCSVGPSM